MGERKGILVASAEELYVFLLGCFPHDRYRLALAPGLREAHEHYAAMRPHLLIVNLEGSGWRLTPIIAEASSHGAVVLGLTSTRDHRWIPRSVNRVVQPDDFVAAAAAAAELLCDRAFAASGYARIPLALQDSEPTEALLIEPDLLWLPQAEHLASATTTPLTLTIADATTTCAADVRRGLVHAGHPGVGLKLDDARIARRLAAVASLHLIEAHERAAMDAGGASERIEKLIVAHKETLRRQARAEAALDDAPSVAPSDATEPAKTPPAATEPDGLKHQLAADTAAIEGMSHWVSEIADTLQLLREDREREIHELRRTVEQQQSAIERLSGRLEQALSTIERGNAEAPASGAEASYQHQLSAHQRQLDGQVTVINSLSERFNGLRDVLVTLHSGLRQLDARVASTPAPAPAKKTGERRKDPTGPAPLDYGRRGMAEALRRLEQERTEAASEKA